jgi:very-short-patch-repair endonuclease
VPEADLGALLVRAGLPAPVHHHVVTLPSGRVIELDWAYPERRIGLEVDGYVVHVRSAEAFAADRDRLNQLRLVGWVVLQFAPTTIHRRPRRVVAQVAAALGVAA